MYINIKLFSTSLEKPFVDFYSTYRPKDWDRPFHTHNYYQFMLVIDGQLDIESNNRKDTLTRGMVSIIPPEILHSFHTEVGHHLFGISLAEDQEDPLIQTLNRHIKEHIVVNTPGFLELLPEIDECNRHQTMVSIQIIRNRLEYMLLYCIQMMNKHNNQQFFNEKLIQYFREHISENMTLDELSKKLFISSSHIERLSNKEFGCGAIHLFNRLKIDEACMLLQTSDQRISDIASNLGYSDQNYFSRLFFKFYGVSPSEYRKRQK